MGGNESKTGGKRALDGEPSEQPLDALDDDEIDESPFGRHIPGESALLNQLSPTGTSALRFRREDGTLAPGASGGGAHVGSGSGANAAPDRRRALFRDEIEPVTDDDELEDEGARAGSAAGTGAANAASNDRRGHGGRSTGVSNNVWLTTVAFAYTGPKGDSAAAVRCATGMDALNWKRSHGGQNNFYTPAVYNCASHVGCKVKQRLRHDGEPSCFELSHNDAEHAGGQLLQWLGKGIGGEFREEVLTLCSKGYGPDKVLTELKLKYSTAPYADVSKLSRIPDVAKIKACKQAAQTDGEWAIETYVALLEWVGERRLDNKEQLDSVPVIEQDYLRVLHTFELPAKVVDKHGVEKDVETMGIVFASARALRALRYFITKFGGILALQADGTYRLHLGGWVLCDVGIIVIRWDAKTRSSTQSFIPLMYLWCRTECKVAYQQLFNILMTAPIKYLGLRQPLRVNIGGLDRTQYIADAYQQTWPGITLTLCWPHIARKFKEGDFKRDLKDAPNSGEIEAGIRILHNCRTRDQFELLAECIFEYWTTSLDEEAFARRFERMCGQV